MVGTLVAVQDQCGHCYAENNGKKNDVTILSTCTAIVMQ